MVGANAKIRRFAGFVVLAGFPLPDPEFNSTELAKLHQAEAPILL
jgi:hypothetical protein